MPGSTQAALVMLAAALMSCDFAEKTKKNIESRVREGTATPPQNPTPPALASEVVVSSLRPSRGPAQGSTSVDISGLGFLPESRVFFGDTEVVDAQVQVVSDTKIIAVTPGGDVGPVGVRVVTPRGAALLESAFVYYAPVALERLEPAHAPSTGGTPLTLYGSGFVEPTFVYVDGQEVQSLLLSASSLQVMLPVLPRGRATISVSNINGRDALEGGLEVFDPVRLYAVEPMAGPFEGEMGVVLRGTGLIAGTEVYFGSETIAGESRQGGTELAGYLSAPGDSRQVGAVEVRVANAFGEASLAPGYFFVDPTQSESLVAVQPGVGLVEGDSAVDLVVVGFDASLADSVSVWFGERAASGCVATSRWTLRCLAPAGEVGAVDVMVKTSTQEATLQEGYRYVDLGITRVQPAQGAVAGGTYVEISGSGLTPSSCVTFGGNSALEVTWVDATHLTLKTPPGRAGPVDVHLEDFGISVAASAAFTYFDPSSSGTWTGGGPVEGSINVTVIDERNRRLEGAIVMLGETPGMQGTQFGYTNRSGQVTLSAPDLFGPQSVHVGSPGFSAFSWLEVDARNLVAMLQPIPKAPPPPLPDCPRQKTASLPVVRGSVVRAKDLLSPASDTVVVTTTYHDLATPLPDPGPLAIVSPEGRYEINTRTGDLVLIALAGSFSPEGRFDVHAMGFRGFVFTEEGSGESCASSDDCNTAQRCSQSSGGGVCTKVYENMDITLDTPLEQSLQINLDAPPFRNANESALALAPDRASAFVWYDFGYMGVWPMGTATEANTSTLYLDMPQALPEALGVVPFHVTGGVYRSSGTNTYPPQSVARQYDNIDTSLAVELTPLLKTHDEMIVSPQDGAIGRASFKLRPQGNTQPTATLHLLYNYVTLAPCLQAPALPRTAIRWLLVSQGSLTNFTLPRFPESVAEANPPSGQLNWQVQSHWIPGIDYHHTDLNGLLQWESQSLNVSWFYVP